MKKGLFILVYLFSYQLYGQSFCPVLETVSFGENMCVPSTGEICHSGQPLNCETNPNMTIECTYVRGPSTYITHTEHRMGFKCVREEQQNCEPGEDPNCPPAKCVEYARPDCANECKKCFEEDYKKSFPQIGCNKYCNDPYCDDEPGCSVLPAFCRENPRLPGCPKINSACTVTNITVNDILYIIPKEYHPKCQSDHVCPTTVMPPARNPPIDATTCPSCDFNPDGSVNVHITNLECDPPKLEESDAEWRRKSCPWIKYVPNRFPSPPKPVDTCNAGTEGEGAIVIGNRFPQDCKECHPDPAQVPNPFTCNIPAERCNQP